MKNTINIGKRYFILTKESFIWGTVIDYKNDECFKVLWDDKIETTENLNNYINKTRNLILTKI